MAGHTGAATDPKPPTEEAVESVASAWLESLRKRFASLLWTVRRDD